MCVDHSPPADRPAVRHDAGPVRQIDLEPVDSVEIITLMDNVTDIFMPDQGPARRPGLAVRPTRSSAIMVGGLAPDVLIAEHGFSVLVKVHMGGSSHRLLFDVNLRHGGLLAWRPSCAADKITTVLS